MTDTDPEYTEFRAALKGVSSAKKVRELALSEGFDLIPGCTDRDMLVYDLWVKRKARKHNVGSPSVTPSPLAPDAEGGPALLPTGPSLPSDLVDQLQAQLRAEAVEPVVVVRTRRVPQRNRAKHTFTLRAQSFPVGHFSEKEWALIKADPELVVKWPTQQ